MDSKNIVKLLSLEADSNSLSTKDLRLIVDNFTKLVEILLPDEILNEIRVQIREGSQAIDLIANAETKINRQAPYQYIANFINDRQLPSKKNKEIAKKIRSLCQIEAQITVFTPFNSIEKINFDKSLLADMEKIYLSDNIHEIIEMGIIEGIIHSISDTKAGKYNQIKIEERVSRKIIPCLLNENLIQKIIENNFWQKLVIITGIIHYSTNGEYKKIKANKVESYRESFGL
jgi:hypothetical protein